MVQAVCPRYKRLWEVYCCSFDAPVSSDPNLASYRTFYPSRLISDVLLFQMKRNYRISTRIWLLFSHNFVLETRVTPQTGIFHKALQQRARLISKPLPGCEKLGIGSKVGGGGGWGESLIDENDLWRMTYGNVEKVLLQLHHLLTQKSRRFLSSHIEPILSVKHFSAKTEDLFTVPVHSLHVYRMCCII